MAGDDSSSGEPGPQRGRSSLVTPPGQSAAEPRGSNPWRELRRLHQMALAGWARGRRPWLGAAAALASIVTALVLHERTVGQVVRHAGDVTASIPVTVELYRLPMSLFLPTPLLPLWGAAAQLLVVIGLGELVLGRWLTLLAAGVGQVSATFAARLLLDVSAGRFVGLPHFLAHALDTGPSGVTVAVGACVLMASRCHQLTAVLAAALLLAACLGPGLDGPEHLVALVSGVLLGALTRRFRPEGVRRAHGWRRMVTSRGRSSWGPSRV